MLSEDWKVRWSPLIWLWPRISLSPWTSISRSAEYQEVFQILQDIIQPLHFVLGKDHCSHFTDSCVLLKQRILHSSEFQHDSDRLSVKTFPVNLLAIHECSFKHNMLRFPLVTQHGTGACGSLLPQLGYALKKFSK